MVVNHVYHLSFSIKMVQLLEFYYKDKHSCRREQCLLKSYINGFHYL